MIRARHGGQSKRTVNEGHEVPGTGYGYSPAPFEPTRMAMEPFGRTRSTPFRAGSFEVDEGKVKVRSRTSMARSLLSEAPLDAISAEGLYSVLCCEVAVEGNRDETSVTIERCCDESRAFFAMMGLRLRVERSKQPRAQLDRQRRASVQTCMYSVQHLCIQLRLCMYCRGSRTCHNQAIRADHVLADEESQASTSKLDSGFSSR